MAKSLQEQLLDKMYELQEQYAGLLEIRKANRETLRNLVAQDILTAEQAMAVEEVYPARRRSAEEA